jgi:hypothetical protein
MPTRFEAIGPAAIKLGQALSTRPDLIGHEAARLICCGFRMRCRRPVRRCPRRD